ncbi:hypothetical protein K501DRAFT_224695 [Backusella circina FSU 941]|nr:hypothetical protein K501DRAFT_224695 [Backusella circina FSU 941]
MGYDTVGLTVSRSEAERLESENAKRLLKNRKLSLILDLDQTLLHASCDPVYHMDDDIRQFTLEGSPILYYIKLRPGLSDFLREIEPLYELHIYTMGTRAYAESVAQLIDPNGNFFKERILSRDESGSVTQKKLQRLFPCDTSMVVVIDDRSDVWNYSPNLLRIKPFEYFVGTGDINSKEKNTLINPSPVNHVSTDDTSTDSNPSDEKASTENNTKDDNNVPAITLNSIAGKEKETEKKDEKKAKSTRDQDNELYTIQEILKKIHTSFYTQNPQTADVTRIIPFLKCKILENKVIVFADVIPPTTKDPTLSWIWQMATSFGATCSTDLTGKTTHLIAVNAFCSKVKAARLYGHSIHVVTPGWLLDSTARWAIQDEGGYALPAALSPLPDEGETTSTSVDDEEEEEEKLNLDWAEADREVEDFINESGIDDTGDTDSDATNTIVDFRRKKRRHKYQNSSESGGENSGEEEEHPKRPFLAIRRARAKRRGKSHLSKVTTVSGNSTDNELNSDMSSLDDFAGVLDSTID